ncbi:DUF6527 family protein [Nitrobacter sp. TKz-YC02]|uniref:DUF6527 family protein n=1 Tax=Nitrobacter sp. TKz-YC02 TaxID=3398704 RepID=UPI003CF85243
MNVGNGFKPADGPSWQWNGSLDKPTLTPSMHHVGHWHGWRTDGIWRRHGGLRGAQRMSSARLPRSCRLRCSGADQAGARGPNSIPVNYFGG